MADESKWGPWQLCVLGKTDSLTMPYQYLHSDGTEAVALTINWPGYVIWAGDAVAYRRQLGEAIGDDRPVSTSSPAPKPSKWIPWAGGECPVPGDARVKIKCANGTTSSIWDKASASRWGKSDSDYDIIAYRVRK